MSTVSYANVVANGSASPSSTSTSNGTSAVQSPVAIDSATTSTNSATTGTEEIKEQKEEDKKPKDKKLAPAPVPTTSAWGSVTSVNSANIDQHKWPTPDQQGPKPPVSSKPQKFTKASTTKWVPINAKVILPSSRTQNQPNNKKNNKKNPNVKNNKNKKNANGHANTNATTNTNTNTSTNGVQKQKKSKEDETVEKLSELSIDKEEPVSPETTDIEPIEHVSEAASEISEPVSTTGSTTTTGSPATRSPVPGSSSTSPGTQSETTNSNGQYYNRSYNNKANYRNNRYSLPNNQYGNYMQYPPYHHQSLPTNYYPYPQPPMTPFNMGAPVPGFPPYPQQFPMQNIPPPITAKQDPISALTQQIDYYFSFENLIKDVYLRKSFDKETGFVPVSNILSFKRVEIILNQIKQLNLNKDYDEVIKDAIKSCNNIDINDNEDLNKIEIRVKNDYKKFILD